MNLKPAPASTGSAATRPQSPLPAPVKFMMAVSSFFLALYALIVVAAYAWLTHGRNLPVSWSDVAFLRVQHVRRVMATRQFDEAKDDLAKKDYRAAYIAYASALRRDPDNVAGRIDAADFFGSVGSLKTKISTLEDGLSRAQENLPLTDATLGLLTSTGRDRSALELIRRLYGEHASGKNAEAVETYRILATLNTGDVELARGMLEQAPELRRSQQAPVALATVLWQLREKVAAIGTLSRYVAGGSARLVDFSQLAHWEAEGGMADDAVATARRALAAYPAQVTPRVLLIEMLSVQSPGSAEVQHEIHEFLSDLGGRPEAVLALAELAGRKGWLEIARGLYLATADHPSSILRMLAIYYSDALAFNARLAEEQVILQQLDEQAEGAGPAFGIQLRRREIFAAANRGDNDAVREESRQLAADVQLVDPDSLESYRRLFSRLGIKEAAAAFAAR